MTDPEQEPLDPSTTPEKSAPTWDDVPYGMPTVPAAGEFGPTPRLPARPFPAWSIGDVIAVLGFTVAAILGFSVVALGVAHIATSGRHVAMSNLATSPFVVIGAQVAAYPIVIFFMMVLVRARSGAPFWQAIGWNWPGGSTPGFLLSGILFALLVEYCSRWLPIPKSLPVDKFFSDATGAYLMAGFGITLAPLLEELFFRGMLYPLLRRAWGIAAGVLVTAVAFAGIHGAQLGYAWGPLLSIFVVGVVFTLVRQLADSVAASFLMHCGYNSTLFGILWFASDHFRHLERVTN